ncbi:hypothetical protein PMAYCL1PPCAC_11411, partial [Pristionchus mayeri]
FRVNKCHSEMEVHNLETCLYSEILSSLNPQTGDTVMEDVGKMIEAKRNLRNRLLNEFVRDDVIIEKQDFMVERCISILDGYSELLHTPWQWMYQATELIIDVGHRMCPSPAIAEKKSTKTKKQLAATEDYHTM